MRLLHSAARYTKSKTDLKSIYQTYIRPILKQSAAVWHSSLTEENINHLNRVQKSAVGVIMESDYIIYIIYNKYWRRDRVRDHGEVG